MDIKDIEKIVWDLNCEYGYLTESIFQTLNPIKVYSDGNNIGVDFFDKNIWWSDVDERNFDIDGYEPLEGFLRKRITKLCKDLSKVNLIKK
jgi:hypothetical protein